MPSFLLQLFNDLDLMGPLRLTDNEFQYITTLKDIICGFNVSSRGRCNLNRLLPLRHTLIVLWYIDRFCHFIIDFIINNDLWKSFQVWREIMHVVLKSTIELSFAMILFIFAIRILGVNWFMHQHISRLNVHRGPTSQTKERILLILWPT